MSVFLVSQALPYQPTPSVQYVHTQQLCVTNSRKFLVETEDAPDSKVSQVAGSVFDTALSGIGRVFSAVNRGFRWIDSFFPKAAFAAAQVLPAPNENEPAKAKYTLEEQAFLGELEAYVQLARIVQEDTRYLFVIDEMIKAYMKKNNAIAFPVHMSRATELLSTLESWQSNIMDRIDLDAADFVKPKPLSENCFYHQVQEAVKSAQWTRTLKERVLFTRVVQLIVETYLSSNNHTLLPANVSDKFGEITDKLCGIFERELLSKNLPYLTGD